MKSNCVLQNPFIGRTDGVVFPGQVFDSFDDKNITESYEKEVIQKIGPGEEDFKVIKKVDVYKVYNRDAYIQDQSDDVGILNVLKKVALSGVDLTQDNPYAAKPGYVDLTQFPEDIAGAQELVAKARETWLGLPDELKSNMDMETFVKTMTTQKVYDALYAQEAAKHQEEEGDK